MRNLITDVAGVRRSAMPTTPGSAPASPRSCSTSRRSPRVDVRGGGPGTRETDLLDPAQTVERHRRDRAVRRLGLRARCRLRRAGLAARTGPRLCGRATRAVPIVPGAILFDLLNGGDKDWGRYPALSRARLSRPRSAPAPISRSAASAPGSAPPPSTCKGGLGSASAQTRDGITVGALVVVNAVGSVTDRRRPAFLGGAVRAGRRIRRTRLAAGDSGRRARAAHQGRRARRAPRSRVVATDAMLTKAQAKRLAVMAQTGLRARDLSGAHAARRRHRVRRRDRAQSRCADPLLSARRELGMAGRQCAGARRSRAASTRRPPCPFAGALPSWTRQVRTR